MNYDFALAKTTFACLTAAVRGLSVYLFQSWSSQTFWGQHFWGQSVPRFTRLACQKTVPLQERNTKALCFVTCIAMLSPHLLTQSVLGLKWTCEPGCWQPYVAAMLPTPSKGKHPAIVTHCSKCPVATKTGCHSKLLEHRWWCSFGCFAQEFGRTGSQAPANPRLHVDEGSLTPYGPCTSLSQVRFEIQ